MIYESMLVIMGASLRSLPAVLRLQTRDERDLYEHRFMRLAGFNIIEILSDGRWHIPEDFFGYVFYYLSSRNMRLYPESERQRIRERIQSDIEAMDRALTILATGMETGNNWPDYRFCERERLPRRRNPRKGDWWSYRYRLLPEVHARIGLPRPAPAPRPKEATGQANCIRALGDAGRLEPRPCPRLAAVTVVRRGWGMERPVRTQLATV